jgi:acyl dehydratase
MTLEFWQRSVEVHVTVSTQDFRAFAELTKDDAPHHLDSDLAKSRYVLQITHH